MKILFDFFPIFAFFVTYMAFGQDIYLATKVIMAATFLQMAYLVLRKLPIGPLHIASAVLAWGLGGLVLIFHNAVFIKWKPTIASWTFATAFLGSQFIGKKPLIQRMLAKEVQLDARSWRNLNLAWVVFFLFSGLLNLYVVYNFSEAFWVKFKLFGLFGLTLAFSFAQGIWFYRKGAIVEPDAASGPEHPNE